MVTVATNEFKSGLKIIQDGSPCNIVENEFVKPGKGQAFNRVKIKNLLNGRVVEKTFKSGESVELADVIEVSMQYLYCDGEYWHFMNLENFEQLAADQTVTKDAALWLKEQDMCEVTLWNNNPILITPANFVNLVVTDTDPGLRGDTSSGGSKPATVNTGAVIKVPLFIQIGETIKVDTRTGEYVSRCK